MNESIDKLIQDARPKVDPAARERVLNAARAEFAPVSDRPGSIMIFMRAAAVLVLALGAGAVTAYVVRPPAVAERPVHLRVSSLQARLDALDRSLQRSDIMEDEMAEVALKVDELEQERADAFNLAIRETVTSQLDARDARRREEWRERHIQYTRRHYARQAEATVDSYREELELSAKQEARVRDLLDEQGRKIETLISSAYGDDRYHVDVRGGLKRISEDTTDKLSALLDPDQREFLPRGEAIISADPQDWAPDDEFESASDIDAWVNWMTISTE